MTLLEWHRVERQNDLRSPLWLSSFSKPGQCHNSDFILSDRWLIPKGKAWKAGIRKMNREAFQVLSEWTVTCSYRNKYCSSSCAIRVADSLGTFVIFLILQKNVQWHLLNGVFLIPIVVGLHDSWTNLVAWHWGISQSRKESRYSKSGLEILREHVWVECGGICSSYLTPKSTETLSWQALTREYEHLARREDFGNYSPVSLISVPSKIMWERPLKIFTM